MSPAIRSGLLRPGTRWRWPTRSARLSSIAISAGRATAGRQAAEVSRAPFSPSGEGSAMRVLGLASSDRQRDLPDQTGENEQSAEAVAVALVRQKEAAEADQCGEGHGDLT